MDTSIRYFFVENACNMTAIGCFSSQNAASSWRGLQARSGCVVICGARRKVRRHQIELVGVALKNRRGFFFSHVPPDRMQCADNSRACAASGASTPRQSGARCASSPCQPHASISLFRRLLESQASCARTEAERGTGPTADGRSEPERGQSRSAADGQRQKGIVGILGRDHCILEFQPSPPIVRPSGLAANRCLELRDYLQLPRISRPRSRAFATRLTRPADLSPFQSRPAVSARARQHPFDAADCRGEAIQCKQNERFHLKLRKCRDGPSAVNWPERWRSIL